MIASIPIHRHVVNLAPGGSFADTGAFATTREDVDAIVAAIAAHPSKRLTVHFHGGLVSEARGLGIAERMTTHYRDVSYPLTFAWETGLLETVCANLSSIWTTKLFQKLASIIANRATEALGISVSFFEAVGPMDAPPIDVAVDLSAAEAALEAEIAQDLANDEPALARAIHEAARGPHAPALETSRDEALLESTAALSILLKPAVKIALEVVRRFAAGRDHGLWPTVIEEILRELYLADLGRWAWDRMKASARGMWHGDGGGRYFLERLGALPEKPAIDLVGHSAGSIAICHMLEAWLDGAASPLPVRGIYFLAPACRHDLFVKTIVEGAALYERFRMFTMNDERESQDALVDLAPFVYPRSLLYLVSGAFERDGADHPIVGMQRYLFDREPYRGGTFDAVRAFFAEADRACFSPHHDCDAEDHGRFDEDIRTLEALRKHVDQ